MAIQLANGSTIQIASAYGSAAAVSAISNADPAIASGAFTFADGDAVEVTSGWSRLNSQVVRAANVSGASFTLEGINTSNAQQYPAGSGGGSARAITAWTQVSQVTGFSTSGGDQQFVSYQPLEATQERQLPTVQSATSLSLTIADDTSLPHYAVLKAASDDREARAIKIVLPNGAEIYYNAIVSLNPNPALAINAINTITVTLSLQADPSRYSAPASSTT